MASLIFSSLGLLAYYIANDPVPPICILLTVSLSIIVASIYMFAFYKWDRNVATFASMAVAFLPALIPKEIDDVVIDRNQITLALVITIFYYFPSSFNATIYNQYKSDFKKKVGYYG